MVQIIKDFQVSIKLNPETQFNQQWTGNVGNQNEMINEGEPQDDGNYIQDQEVEGGDGEEEELGEGDEEGESVYMIDGVVMRMI